MMLRRLTHVLAVLLLSVLSILANGQSEEKNTSIVDYSSSNPNVISQDPLELTVWFHARNTIVYKEDWPVEQEARSMTNIYLRSVAPKNSTSSQESFQIHLASGQLADIVGLDMGRDDFMTYGMEGAFIPLDDLIEQYAPDIKKLLDERPSLRNYITAADGKIYFIPYVSDGAAAGGYFIRKDWLDAIGLSVPDTVDEYYKVLKAFKEMDPNGNGEADEVPYLDRSHDGKETYRLVTLWGGHSEEFYMEDDKIYYSFMQPEFKEGMINIAKWYKEGLIDTEVLTRGKKSRDILFGNNTGGSTHDWFGSTAGYNDKLKSRIPGFELIPMAPPINSKGERVEEFVRSPYRPDGWAISVMNKHPVETIKYMNFWFSEKGRRLANYGIEGVQYDMIDGKPIFKPEVLNSSTNVLDQLWEIGAQIPKGFWQDFEYERQWLNPIAKKGIEMYMENGYLQDTYPVLTFTPEEKEIYDRVYTNITTYAEEMHQKWLLGAEDVEETWERYVQTLISYGVNDLVATQQSAYDRIK